jgi:hypothetical protein
MGLQEGFTYFVWKFTSGVHAGLRPAPAPARRVIV